MLCIKKHASTINGMVETESLLTPLHLHCLLFGVLEWVSVQHVEISADVRRAL
jgi:hypothetical protein